MEKKEYLNEEIYERGKKNLKTIALIILLVGLFVGGSLILTGIVKTNKAKQANVEITDKAEEKQPERTESIIQSEIDALNEELIPLKAQKSSEFKTNGFSEEYYRLDNEIDKKEEKIRDLESELFDLENGISDTFGNIFNNTKDQISTIKYVPFYIIGAFIIIVSCIISGSIYLFAKRREIKAFTIQQTMPVTQEVIDKIAPTVGNAAGTIGKDIAKGITSGIKESLNDEEK
ncbi:MAG: hypothetical protein IJY25_00030 [Bacilli bacterium]|nr:hypothetical protein [Bacilli bacterium]